MRNDGVGWFVAFVGGFLLGSLLTGGVFGTYLLFTTRHRMEAERARDAMQEALMQRELAEQHRADAEVARREAEARIRELEAKQKP